MADIYALPEPINGEIFGHKLEDLEEALKLLTEADMKKLDELEKFAMFFKNARVNFGFTQLDVGHALGPRYGAEFSQTTISRFEACNLSFKNMCKLQPILEQWICEAEKALLNGTSVGAIVELGTSGSFITEDEDSPMKRRKRRTQLSLEQINILEVVFRIDQRPSLDYMSTLAEEMSLGLDVVKIWFCNRRQKKKRNCEIFEKPDLNNLKGVLITEPTPKKKGRRPRHFPPEDDGQLPTCSGAAQSSSSTILQEFFINNSSMSLISQTAHEDALIKGEQIFEERDDTSCQAL